VAKYYSNHLLQNMPNEQLEAELKRRKPKGLADLARKAFDRLCIRVFMAGLSDAFPENFEDVVEGMTEEEFHEKGSSYANVPIEYLKPSVLGDVEVVKHLLNKKVFFVCFFYVLLFMLLCLNR
jgi:hypothetical protein